MTDSRSIYTALGAEPATATPSQHTLQVVDGPIQQHNYRYATEGRVPLCLLLIAGGFSAAISYANLRADSREDTSAHGAGIAFAVISGVCFAAAAIICYLRRREDRRNAPLLMFEEDAPLPPVELSTPAPRQPNSSI